MKQYSMKISRVSRRVIVGLIIAVVGGVMASLLWGTTPVTPVNVLAALCGSGDAVFTVRELRLPRAIMAVCAGLAFGLSGAVFQSLLRNPLASPDIIGVSAGASCAAVFGIVVLGVSGGALSLLAGFGALAAAGAIAWLASGPGAATSRMVLIGVGAAAMLTSLVALILSRTPAWDLPAAMQWLAGSLNDASWASLAPLAFTCALVIPIVLFASSRLSVLRLGDDLAAGLGMHPAVTRWVILAFAVLLLAAATAATGPITFVAFLAGPVAIKLHGSGAPGEGTTLVAAALVGAALVVWADLAGQLLFAHRYPVGVITGALGAPALIALLLRAGGTRRAPRSTSKVRARRPVAHRLRRAN